MSDSTLNSGDYRVCSQRMMMVQQIVGIIIGMDIKEFFLIESKINSAHYRVGIEIFIVFARTLKRKSWLNRMLPTFCGKN